MSVVQVDVDVGVDASVNLVWCVEGRSRLLVEAACVFEVPSPKSKDQAGGLLVSGL
jgi:hypothetical protein